MNCMCVLNLMPILLVRALDLDSPITDLKNIIPDVVSRASLEGTLTCTGIFPNNEDYVTIRVLLSYPMSRFKTMAVCRRAVGCTVKTACTDNGTTHDEFCASRIEGNQFNVRIDFIQKINGYSCKNKSIEYLFIIVDVPEVTKQSPTPSTIATIQTTPTSATTQTPQTTAITKTPQTTFTATTQTPSTNPITHKFTNTSTNQTSLTPASHPNTEEEQSELDVLFRNKTVTIVLAFATGLAGITAMLKVTLSTLNGGCPKINPECVESCWQHIKVCKLKIKLQVQVNTPNEDNTTDEPDDRKNEEQTKADESLESTIDEIDNIFEETYL